MDEGADATLAPVNSMGIQCEKNQPRPMEESNKKTSCPHRGPATNGGSPTLPTELQYARMPLALYLTRARNPSTHTLP
jgi:hypothetical protein